MSHQVGYVDARYLKTAAHVFAPIKQHSYEMMRIQFGQRILDVGCGPGIDTVHIAQIVGSKGRVIGIDKDDNLLTEADRRAHQTGVGDIVVHRRGDAVALPFDSDYFDACRSERLFIHLRQPEKALAEMTRVTKSEGHIVVIDTDAATISFDTRETETERKLFRFRAEKLLNNGYSGRQLYRLFRQCHLNDIDIDMFPLHTTDYTLARYIAGLDETEQRAAEQGFISRTELDNWHRDLDDAADGDTFFASVSVVVVAGRKP
jgi:ubiquinone/menaquinone biosynthesis C-methylase UbiE